MRPCDVDYGWDSAYDGDWQYTLQHHSLRSRFHILKGYCASYQE